MERTLIILKPDAVRRNLVGEILSRFERRGFKIIALKMEKLKREVIEQHYDHIRTLPVFNKLVDYMCESEAVLAILEGENVLNLTRIMMGDKAPEKALPGTIRAEFASNITINLIHGSDSPETYEIEVRRFFPELF